MHAVVLAHTILILVAHRCLRVRLVQAAATMQEKVHRRVCSVQLDTTAQDLVLLRCHPAVRLAHLVQQIHILVKGMLVRA